MEGKTNNRQAFGNCILSFYASYTFTIYMLRVYLQIINREMVMSKLFTVYKHKQRIFWLRYLIGKALRGWLPNNYRIVRITHYDDDVEAMFKKLEFRGSKDPSIFRGRGWVGRVDVGKDDNEYLTITFLSPFSPKWMFKGHNQPWREQANRIDRFVGIHDFEDVESAVTTNKRLIGKWKQK